MDRRLIPVQHRPLQTTAAPLLGQSRDIGEQCPAKAAPAKEIPPQARRFRNGPNTDFTLEENREKQRVALRNLKGKLDNDEELGLCPTDKP